MIESAAQRELVELAIEFEKMGFPIRQSAPFFAHNGVAVAATKVLIGHPPISLLESTVFLYREDPSWQARVTIHGGPHWVRSCRDISELREAPLEALTHPKRPPGPAWVSDD